jgi:hypothetical protein
MVKTVLVGGEWMRTDLAPRLTSLVQYLQLAIGAILATKVVTALLFLV